MCLGSFRRRLFSYAVEFAEACRERAAFPLLRAHSSSRSSDLVLCAPGHKQISQMPPMEPLPSCLWAFSFHREVEYAKTEDYHGLGGIASWRRAYVSNRHVASITALASGAVAFPGVTREIVWLLLQAASLPEAACAVLRRASCGTSAEPHVEQSRPVLFAGAHPSPSNEETVRVLSTADQQSLSLLSRGRRSRDLAEAPGRESYYVHEASVTRILYNSLCTLAWPVVGAVLRALHIVAFCQGFASLRQLASTHVHFFLTRWVASRQPFMGSTRLRSCSEYHKECTDALSGQGRSPGGAEGVTSVGEGCMTGYRVGSWCLPWWPWHLLEQREGLFTEKSFRGQAAFTFDMVTRATAAEEPTGRDEKQPEEDRHLAGSAATTRKPAAAQEEGLRQHQEDEPAGELARDAQDIPLQYSEALLAGKLGQAPPLIPVRLGLAVGWEDKRYVCSPSPTNPQVTKHGGSAAFEQVA